jgi:hypothetical protein
MARVRIPDRPEDTSRGMVTDRSPKRLQINESVLVQNTFPDLSNKPRNGFEDRVFSETRLGDGNEHTFYQQRPIYIRKGDKDWFFHWARNRTDKSKHNLEIWNATDDVRTSLIYGDWPQEDVYFGMTKLYNAIYCVMEYEMSSNPNSEYRTKNKVIEWDEDSSSWTVREIAIDVSPSMPGLVLGELVNSDLYLERRNHSLSLLGGKVFLVGGNSSGGSITGIIQVSSTPNFKRWVVESQEADWGTVSAKANVITYKGKLWVFDYDSVYNSSDGKAWTEVATSVAELAKFRYSLVVFDGKMWVIGGYDGSSTYYDDVYYSTDGITWTAATTSAAFGGRAFHTSVVFDNKMWVIGGSTTLGVHLDDVYSSTDGVTWSLVQATAAFGALADHASLVYDGKMWVLGGYSGSASVDDVWYSSDGVTWVAATTAAEFGALRYLDAIVFQGLMYVVGGLDGSNTVSSIYRSSDGSSWEQVPLGPLTNKYIRYAYQYVRRENAVLEDINTYKMHRWVTDYGRTHPGPDERLLTGTIDYNGGTNALTGTNTLFSTELSVGDRIRPGGADHFLTISAISNDTTATCEETGHSYSSLEYSLLPSDGEYISGEVYEPGEAFGVYDSDGDEIFLVQGSGSNALVGVEMPEVTDAVAQGATHLRIFKSLEADDFDTAAGLSPRWMIDIPIANDYFDSTAIFWDEISDATMQGRTNTVDSVTGLSGPPLGRFVIWAGDRLWVGGNPDNPGYWYPSQKPSNTQFPESFAGQFDLVNDYVTVDPDDNQKDSGCVYLDKDLYFFKERKIFMLDHANLDNLPPRNVSNSIGCVMPETITPCDVPELGGKCVLFMSESGPAQLLPGGSVRLLREFSVEQLWPDGETLQKSDGDPTDWYTRNRVTAQWYKNSWFIFYGDSEDSDCNLSTNKCFVLYANPQTGQVAPCQFVWGLRRLVLPYPVPSEDFQLFEAKSLAVKSDVESYMLSHLGGTYRVSRLLKPGVFIDTHLPADSPDFFDLAFEMKIESRHLFADPATWAQRIRDMRLRVHMNFDDTDGLVLQISTDGGRLVASCTYSADRQSGAEEDNTVRNFIDVVAKQWMFGDFVKISVTKTVPTDGDVEYFWAQIQGETTEYDGEHINAFEQPTGNTTLVVDADDDETDAHA